MNTVTTNRLAPARHLRVALPRSAVLLSLILRIAALLSAGILVWVITAVPANALGENPIEGIDGGNPLLATPRPEDECLAVSGPRILAGELAAAIPSLAALPADLDLGYSPAPGLRRWLQPANFLVGAAGEGGSALSLPERPASPSSQRDTQLQPDPRSAPVCVVRAMRELTADSIRKSLVLPPERDFRIEVVASSGVTLSEGILHFPLDGAIPAANNSSLVLWRGVLRYEGGRTLPLWARVKLTSRARCFRVDHKVERGQTVEASWLRTAPCDARAILGRALREGDPIPRRVASRRILRGEWLMPSLLTEPMAIAAKEAAMLVVRAGDVRITVPVISEEAGRRGDRIWVRTQETRTRVDAEISANGTLKVDLRGSHSERPLAMAISVKRGVPPERVFAHPSQPAGTAPQDLKQLRATSDIHFVRKIPAHP